MPKTHARYWMDESLKLTIEAIASKMDRSASYVAEKFLEAAVEEFESKVKGVVGGESLREKIGKIKK